MIRRAVALAASGCLLAGVAAAPVAASPVVRDPAVMGLLLNVLPVPLPDVYTVAHDKKLNVDRPGVLANDIDADGDKLEARLSKTTAHGHLDLNHDGGFDYQPDHGFTGVDTFTYLAHDGTIGVAAVVTITVTNVAPTGHDDHYSTKESVKLQVDRPGVLKNDDDADGDQLKTKLVNGPDHGKLDLHPEGEFVYEPVHGWSGTDVFTYRAIDGADQSAVIRVTIDVDPKATPLPTATPIPTPDPTPKPTPKPAKGDDPTPRPTREPDPTPTPGAGRGGSHGSGGSGSSGGEGRGGGQDSGKDGNGPTGVDGVPVGAILPPAIATGDDFGLARSTTDTATGESIAFDAGMAAAFDGFAWQVPALALSVPGVIVVIAVFLQVLGGLAWIPLIRRRLGAGGADTRLTPPDRRP